MIVPEHTHNFELPTATKEDILEAKAEDKIVVPSILGSASIAKTEDFATAKQGVKADNAAPAARFIEAGFGLSGGGALTQDIVLEIDKKQLQSLISEQIRDELQAYNAQNAQQTLGNQPIA